MAMAVFFSHFKNDFIKSISGVELFVSKRECDDQFKRKSQAFILMCSMPSILIFHGAPIIQRTISAPLLIKTKMQPIVTVKCCFVSGIPHEISHASFETTFNQMMGFFDSCPGV